MTEEELRKKEVERFLETLNKKVGSVLQERKDFIEDNMHLFADFEIGQQVINSKTFERGIVTEHYHYTGGNNSLLNYDHFDIHCQIRRLNNDGTPTNSYTNTSHYIGRHPWRDYTEHIEVFFGG